MAQSEKNLSAVFTDSANAIRAKKGSSAKIKPIDMADEIASIPTGTTPTGTLPITTNGTHDVTNYASANVNVQPQYDSLTLVENGIYNVTDYKNVNVNVPAYYYYLSMDYEGDGGEKFVNTIMTEDRSGVCKSRIFSNSSSPNYGGSISITGNSISLTLEWVEFDASALSYDFDSLVDIRLLPGGHIDTDSDDQFIVIGAIMDPNYVTRQYIDVYFSISYRNYSGSATEDEVASAWRDLLYSAEIKDLNGNSIGYIQNADITVTLEGSC